MKSTGIRSLAVHLPETIRTNDYYRTRRPQLVADAAERALARLWSADTRGAHPNAWDEAMDPYLTDPFRGTIERRVLGADQTALTMETRASAAALDAVGMRATDVDLALVGSFLPDQIGVGNGPLLARALGLRCPAWNLESTCSTSLAALHLASALVASGQHRNVLVTVSCSYSRYFDEEHDTSCWFLGDGAAAFVVGRTTSGEGWLGFDAVHTAATCGSFSYGLFDDPTDGPRIFLQASREAGKLIRDSAEEYLKGCCDRAARGAGLALKDIDFFALNTPVAWFVPFASRVLGVKEDRMLTTYPRYANVGPALMPVNLHEAARTGRIRRGDRVMLFTVGSVSTSAAMVIRWGDVALG